MTDKRILEFNIDLYGSRTKLLTGLKQYDSTCLIVNVFENDLPAEFDRVEAHYRLTNRDEYHQTTGITHTGNIVYADIPAIALENDGAVDIELLFKTGGSRITSFIFNAVIEPTLNDNTVYPPDDSYVKLLSAADWNTNADGTYHYTLTNVSHNLDLTAYVAAAERLTDDDIFEAVDIAYERYADGGIKVITENPFSGRIILRR